MPSIRKYRTKSGVKWMFKIELGIDPKTGKRRNTTRRGFKSRKLAKKSAEELEQKIKHGYTGKEDKVTFREMAERWLKIYANSGRVKNKTVQTRMFTMKNLTDAFGELRLKSINFDMYQDFIISLKNEKQFSETYIQSIHAIARMIFKMAKKRGIIYTDPTEDVSIPKYEVKPEDVEAITNKYMERDELIEFLQSAKNHRFKDSYNIFFTLAFTGMRLGELIALKWSNVDTDNKEINIRETYSNISTKLSTADFTLPKTTGSIRTITFEDDLINVLKKQGTLIKEAKLKYGKSFHDNGFVFPKLYFRNIGHSYYENFINKSFKEVLSDTNINKKLTPHSLRHTHVSLLAEARVDLQSIMARLGHTSDKTTTKIYMHVTKKMKRSASEKFSSLFQKKSVF